MKRIVILGAGGNCTDILETLLDINEARGERLYDCIGFLDDDPAKRNLSFLGVGVLGGLSEAGKFSDCCFVFGVGSPSNFRRRREILERTGLDDGRFETIVHPTASISRLARLGAGTVVFQNVIIASNAVVGRHVYLLPNAIVSHDAQIGDFTCVAGAACISGKARIGASCYIGAHASIRDGVQVGEFSMVGLGSVAVKDIPPGSVVMGNPARQREASPPPGSFQGKQAEPLQDREGPAVEI